MSRLHAAPLVRHVLFLLPLGAALPVACPAGGTAEAKSVADFTLHDCKGKSHSRKDWAGRKAVVLFFMGTECPVSNLYAPQIELMAKSYAARGVAFYGVQPDPEVTPADAAKHAAEYHLSFPILMDPTQRLARQAGVEVVPEAVVVTPAGEVLYRGRIDDRYALDGKRRDEPRVKDLHNALEAALAGKAPPVRQTRAFGCPLPDPSPDRGGP
jgi:peroxiredoxin